MDTVLTFAPWIWAAVFVITSIITLKVKDIDSLWFSIGSIVSLVLSIIFRNLHFLIQLLIFIVITIVPLLTLSKLIKRRHKQDNLKEISDELIGKKVLIVEDSNEFVKGSGTIDNTVWNIRCQSGHSVKKGEEATIVAIEKHTLIVKQAE